MNFIIIIIIISIITVFAGVLFVQQPGANHAPKASVTQVNHSVHTLRTFLRIRADPSMQIFWISVIAALSDTFLMFSTIPFFNVPSAPTIIIIIIIKNIFKKDTIYRWIVLRFEKKKNGK